MPSLSAISANYSDLVRVPWRAETLRFVSLMNVGQLPDSITNIINRGNIDYSASYSSFSLHNTTTSISYSYFSIPVLSMKGRVAYPIDLSIFNNTRSTAHYLNNNITLLKEKLNRFSAIDQEISGYTKHFLNDDNAQRRSSIVDLYNTQKDKNASIIASIVNAQEKYNSHNELMNVFSLHFRDGYYFSEVRVARDLEHETKRVLNDITDELRNVHDQSQAQINAHYSVLDWELYHSDGSLKMPNYSVLALG